MSIVPGESGSPIWPSQDQYLQHLNEDLKHYNSFIWSILSDLNSLIQTIAHNNYLLQEDPNLSLMSQKINGLLNQLIAPPQPPSLATCEKFINVVNSFFFEAVTDIQGLEQQPSPAPVEITTELFNLTELGEGALKIFQEWVVSGELPEP